VKLGAHGALIKRNGESVTAAAESVTNVLDTTGAGDLWASGFLYGYIQDWPLAECAALGARLGAEVVQRVGADLEEDTWDRSGADIAKQG
jgi:sugar/nucleoside kinase (ribokinase family)